MSDEIRPSKEVEATTEAHAAEWDALARHLAGESAPGDADRLSAWLAAHPVDAAFVDLVKARSARLEASADQAIDARAIDTEAALQRVRARFMPSAAPVLRLETGGQGASRVASQRRPDTRWRMTGFAAAAGIAAVIGVAQYRSATATGEAPARLYQTAVGARDSVRLPDGTTVILAPGSRLQVADGYGAGAREVTLDGAAFFEVRHDAAHPFVVHTAGAEIRDLGTAFSVKTAPEGQVTVAVTQGVVAMQAVRATANPTASPTAAAAELRAGDRGSIVQGALAVRRGVVTTDDVSWTRGVLAYRDTPLDEVRADLHRWYGLDLRVTDDALIARTLTATFRGDSAQQVIQLIALALGAEAIQRGDTVYLQPQGSGPTPNR